MSLGTLDLGFVMVAAAAARVARYDTLAGLGRETDQGRFAHAVRRLNSVQYLFPGWIALLYRVYDGLQQTRRRGVGQPHQERK